MMNSSIARKSLVPVVLPESTVIQTSEGLLYVYLVGPRERVTQAIDQLQVLEFCQRVRWSPVVPLIGSDGFSMSFVVKR
jgi:hypothetical protein